MRFRNLVALVGLASAVSFAAPIAYFANLSGPNESPANASPGIGSAFVTIDTIAHLMTVNVIFSGLTGNTTASHIHCCTALPFISTAGVATQTPTFSGFPLGVTAGSYSNTFDMTLASSYNPAFVTANGSIAASEAALAAAFNTGQAYLNVHSTTFGGGEIRGFLVPTPEPATFALLGAGLLGLVFLRRKL